MSYRLKLKKSIGSKVKMRSVSCYSDKKDDASQNMTVKPSAAMKFYKVVSEVEVSGTEVKLSDVLIMTLELNNEYAGKWRHNIRHESLSFVYNVVFLSFDYCRFSAVIRMFQPATVTSEFEGMPFQMLSITIFVLSLFLRQRQYFPLNVKC